MAITVPGLPKSILRLNYNKQNIRFWSLAYTLLYMSFAYVDYLAAPINYQTFWTIRLCVLPFFMLALLSTYAGPIASYRLFINAVMVFMSPFSVIIMIAISDPAEWSTYIYFGGLVLTIFPIGFILMNALYTVFIAFLVALLYFLVVGVGLNYYHDDPSFFIITSFFVVSALAASILSTYLLENNQNKILSQKRHVEELVEMKTTLINILAHDLRAPCNSIVGFSDLYIKEPENYQMSDAKFFMENINKSANNLLLLLQNLLEWSRIQTKNYNLNQTIVSVDTLIEKNIELAGEAMALKSISLQQTKTEAGLQMLADQYMIDTVLRNLLSNAVKFTPKGGEIDLKYWSSGNLACVSVTDNGVGIDADRLDSLFEFTGTKSTKGTNNETGSGLGLVLCHEFIMKNEGNIWARSESGNGSTFTFTLPLQKTG